MKPLTILSALALSTQLATAASIVVTTSPTAVSAITYDLTSLGTTDWVYWNSTASSGLSGAPTTSKSGGTAIGNVSAVGGGDLRGSSAGLGINFSFSDGTPTPSGTATDLKGIFNTGLATDGAGVTFSIALPTTDLYTINLWTGALDLSAANSSFSATLNGATTYTTSAMTAGASKRAYLTTFTVQADTAGDLLTFDFHKIASTTNSQAIFAGASIGLVPEPGTLVLFLGGLGAMMISRRRRA